MALHDMKYAKRAFSDDTEVLSKTVVVVSFAPMLISFLQHLTINLCFNVPFADYLKTRLPLRQR